jgi:hypothetical protein
MVVVVGKIVKEHLHAGLLSRFFWLNNPKRRLLKSALRSKAGLKSRFLAFYKPTRLNILHVNAP